VAGVEFEGVGGAGGRCARGHGGELKCVVIDVELECVVRDGGLEYAVIDGELLSLNGL